jgi:hypothetical protein
MTLLKRVREARVNYPKNFREDYVVLDDDGVPKTIYCKVTGATLQSTRKIGSREMLAPTDAYAEIEMSFKDGSKHVTAVSKDALKALDDKTLEAIYCADLLQWEREDCNLAEQWVNRKIKGFEVVE